MRICCLDLVVDTVVWVVAEGDLVKAIVQLKRETWYWWVTTRTFTTKLQTNKTLDHRLFQLDHVWELFIVISVAHEHVNEHNATQRSNTQPRNKYKTEPIKDIKDIPNRNKLGQEASKQPSVSDCVHRCLLVCVCNWGGTVCVCV